MRGVGAFFFGLILCWTSEVRADACFDRLVVKLKAFDKVTIAAMNRLKKTGSCSLVDQIVAREMIWVKMVKASKCRVTVSPRPANAIRKDLTRYCKRK